VTDESEDWQSLNPIEFLENYLREQEEAMELTQKRAQFAGMMSSAAAKKKAIPHESMLVVDERANKEVSKFLQRERSEVQERNDEFLAYHQQISQKMADEMLSVRVALIQALGAEQVSSLSPHATTLQLAQGVHQVLTAYRTTAAHHQDSSSAPEPEGAHERYYATLNEKYAYVLTEVRTALVEALGGSEAIPDGATIPQIADAVRSTMNQYRKLIERQSQEIDKLKAMLDKLVERAEEGDSSFVTLYDGSRLNVHRGSDCRSPDCCTIHNPSVHPLKDAPRDYIQGRMYRVCEHGIKHPDPDDSFFHVLIERDGADQLLDYYVDGQECDECCC
jgi:hypothetical protein